MRSTCRAEWLALARAACLRWTHWAGISALMSSAAALSSTLTAEPSEPPISHTICPSIDEAPRNRWVSLAMQARGGDEAVLAKLTARASQGSALAQRLLGELLLTSRDPSRAHEGMDWLLRAANGDADACQPTSAATSERVLSEANVGRAYLLGYAQRAPNPQAALPYLMRAAKSGFALSQLHLALALEQSHSESKTDGSEILQWLHLAASHPVDPQPQAMFLLASRLQLGAFSNLDNALALHWYRRSAAMEYAPALQTLAMAYMHGELGLPRNPAWAQQLLKGLQHAVQHPASRL